MLIPRYDSNCKYPAFLALMTHCTRVHRNFPEPKHSIARNHFAKSLLVLPVSLFVILSIIRLSMKNQRGSNSNGWEDIHVTLGDDIDGDYYDDDDDHHNSNRSNNHNNNNSVKKKKGRPQVLLLVRITMIILNWGNKHQGICKLYQEKILE